MSYIIEARILVAQYRGEDGFIPRIPLRPSNLSFEFKRLQLPVRLNFVMTINKAQGQSLKFVGLNLEEPCFGNGLLYAGCSSVCDEQNLFI